MDSSLVWLEIPAANFQRAINFYEALFNITMEVQQIYDKPMAFFTKEQLGIKGSIVEVPGHTGGGSMKPIFYVSVLYVAMETVQAMGGKVLQQPMLLRQTNSGGEVVIGINRIDNQVGYYAKIKDSEDNELYLYSHS